MLVVDAACDWQVRPLHRLALEVEPQGLMNSTLYGFIVEERLTLSL